MPGSTVPATHSTDDSRRAAPYRRPSDYYTYRTESPDEDAYVLDDLNYHTRTWQEEAGAVLKAQAPHTEPLASGTSAPTDETNRYATEETADITNGAGYDTLGYYKTKSDSPPANPLTSATLRLPSGQQPSYEGDTDATEELSSNLVRHRHGQHPIFNDPGYSGALDSRDDYHYRGSNTPRDYSGSGGYNKQGECGLRAGSQDLGLLCQQQGRRQREAKLLQH